MAPMTRNTALCICEQQWVFGVCGSASLPDTGAKHRGATPKGVVEGYPGKTLFFRETVGTRAWGWGPF